MGLEMFVALRIIIRFLCGSHGWSCMHAHAALQPRHCSLPFGVLAALLCLHSIWSIATWVLQHGVGSGVSCFDHPNTCGSHEGSQAVVAGMHKGVLQEMPL
jgi:hypothetical protein